MKFCIDCRFYQFSLEAKYECTAPENEIVSPVSGEKDYTWITAKAARCAPGDSCGKDAKWFQPKD